MDMDPIIEPSALAAARPLRFLDVRDPTAFQAAHAMKAVRVPVEEWEAAAKADDTSLENIDYWENAISQLGVDNSTLVFVYDDGRMTEAARVWFILQYFGARAVIVNGGWPALSRVDIPVEWTTSSSASFHAKLGIGRVGMVDRTTLQSELGDSVNIFDARTAAEFSGEDLRRNKRGGHLPGARLLPHTALMKESRLRDGDELRKLLHEAGFHPGDHVVTHCDGGGRAALAAVAAVRAGYSDVRAYYLSFSDWARDESCPIERENR